MTYIYIEVVLSRIKRLIKTKPLSINSEKVKSSFWFNLLVENRLVMEIIVVIDLLKQRDEKALAFLYDQYAPVLFGIIIRIVKSEQISEEVLQQTFLKIWEKIDTYDPNKATLFTWMSRIARNTAIDQRRSKDFSKHEKTDSMDRYVDNNVSQTFTTATLDIERLTKDVDDKYKIVLNHVYLMGYSHSQTSEKLGIPIGTVKSRIRKAILELRKMIERERTMLTIIYPIIFALTQIICI